MQTRATREEDVEPTVHALVSAFDADPLIDFLFAESADRATHSAQFFRILLSVRVSLAMPAFSADADSHVLGGVMGYDTSRPKWNESDTTKWNNLIANATGFEARLAEYEALADRFAPSVPHYYLGVIGVRGDAQGRGVGRALLDAFCAMSEIDTTSRGVFLETSSESSLRFYLSNGFELSGEGVLGGGTPLWCVFRPNAQRTA